MKVSGIKNGLSKVNLKSENCYLSGIARGVHPTNAGSYIPKKNSIIVIEFFYLSRFILGLS